MPGHTRSREDVFKLNWFNPTMLWISTSNAFPFRTDAYTLGPTIQNDLSRHMIPDKRMNFKNYLTATRVLRRATCPRLRYPTAIEARTRGKRDIEIKSKCSNAKIRWTRTPGQKKRKLFPEGELTKESNPAADQHHPELTTSEESSGKCRTGSAIHLRHLWRAGRSCAFPTELPVRRC